MSPPGFARRVHSRVDGDYVARCCADGWPRRWSDAPPCPGTYALLVKDVGLAVVAVGLEPLLGFLHQPRYGRPPLALDLMEEMRPLCADSVVITALNTSVVTQEDFVFGANRCGLRDPGRKRLIEAYERRMDQLVTHPLFGYRISYRRVLEVQARLLSRVILGEIADYPAFRTR